MNSIKKGLTPPKVKPTNIKTKEIIADFSQNSKSLFCVVGLEHKRIMKKLAINYLILKNINILSNLSKAKIKQLQKHILNKNIFFLTTNPSDYLIFLKECKKYFLKSGINLYCIDLEILKAMELIPSEELNQNDCLIGLKLPLKCTFKAYIDEVISEDRYKPNDLYEYIKEVLELEEQRQIKGEIYHKI